MSKRENAYEDCYGSERATVAEVSHFSVSYYLKMSRIIAIHSLIKFYLI